MAYKIFIGSLRSKLTVPNLSGSDALARTRRLHASRTDFVLDDEADGAVLSLGALEDRLGE
jgi:hypothetical protein